MAITCDNNSLPWNYYFASIFGVNGSDENVVRTVEVADTGDYFDCDDNKPVDFFTIFKLLVMQNAAGKNALRVTIAATCPTDDPVTCDNAMPDTMAILKKAIGKDADGAPILRICNTAT